MAPTAPNKDSTHPMYVMTFKANLLAFDSWKINKTRVNKTGIISNQTSLPLDTFQHAFKIYWPMRVSSEEVHKRENN